MLRTVGTAALTLLLSTCPFGGETPGGYARIEGRILFQDGRPFQGSGFVICGQPEQGEPTGFGHEFRVGRNGWYSTTLEAPWGYGINANDGRFELSCRINAPASRPPFALRFESVPFSRDRSRRPTTRIDLQEGEIESWESQP